MLRYYSERSGLKNQSISYNYVNLIYECTKKDTTGQHMDVVLAARRLKIDLKMLLPTRD